MKVYVVTGLDLGWDCIVGVFTIENDEQYQQLEKAFPHEIDHGDGDTSLGYHIFEQTVQKFDLANMDQ